jgi:hypothetical protein
MLSAAALLLGMIGHDVSTPHRPLDLPRIYALEIVESFHADTRPTPPRAEVPPVRPWHRYPRTYFGSLSMVLGALTVGLLKSKLKR